MYVTKYIFTGIQTIGKSGVDRSPLSDILCGASATSEATTGNAGKSGSPGMGYGQSSLPSQEVNPSPE